jgi:GTPase SAR1 family protein
LVIVGNKIDLTDERVISTTTATAFAENVGGKFYAEVSAKTGVGISDLFTRAAKLVGGATMDIRSKPAPASPTVAEEEGCC